MQNNIEELRGKLIKLAEEKKKEFEPLADSAKSIDDITKLVHDINS